MSYNTRYSIFILNHPAMNKQILLAFGIVWTILVLIGYWGFHPYYSVALGDLPNLRLFLTLAILSGGAWWVYRTKKVELKGWMIYGFVLLLQSVTFLVYSSGADVFKESPVAHLPYFLGYQLFLHGAVLYLAMVQIAWGELVLRALRLPLADRHRPIASLALGLSVSGLILLPLAMNGWLIPGLLWGISLVPIVFTYRILWNYLKTFFTSPIQVKLTSWWPSVAFLMMLIAMAINHINAVKPFPTGFDAAALYMNSSHLIAQYQGLLQGGQAMAWPLFTSLGELMFRSVSVSILISHMAMLACLWVLYRLGRLFLSPSLALLAIVTMYLSPAFSFHAAFDAKVDLGFLFIVLTILLILLDRQSLATQPSEQADSERSDFLAWGLAGWLSGYAFSVKYTASLVVIGLLVLLFRRFLGWRGAAGMFLVALGALFVVGIDQFGYMELDGVSPNVFAAISGGLGLGLLAWSMPGRTAMLGALSKRLMLILFPALIAFSPWAIKNVMEHDDIQLSHLLTGKSRTPLLQTRDESKGADSHVVRHKRFIIGSFERLGVYFNREQEDVADQIMSGILTETPDAETWIKEYEMARDLLIENALYPDQRETVRSRLATLTTDPGELDPQQVRGLELIVGKFEQRGILLDDSQKSLIQNMLQTSDLVNQSREERKQNLARLREEILDQVLTDGQRDQYMGMKTGSLEFALDNQVVASSLFGGAKREEIKRYLGFEKGAPLYLSLPYDLTMNVNVPFSRYLDISFLFLLLLPFLFFRRRPWVNILVAFGLLLGWLISVRSLYPTEILSNTEALTQMIQMQMGRPTGILANILSPVFIGLQLLMIKASSLIAPLYSWLADLSFLWTFVLLLGGAGLATYLGARKMGVLPEALQQLVVFAITFGGLWFLVGNGIIWYGFAFFALMILLLAWMIEHVDQWIPDVPVKWTRMWWASAYGISLSLCLSLFFVSAIQDQDRAQMIFQSPFLKYASTPIDAKASMQMFRPYMSEAIDKMNEDMDARIYRIGTHLNYYIQQNDRRVLEDDNLDVYKGVSAKMRDKEEFIRLLIDNGFKYVLYNINIASTDRTPEQSLTRKADELVQVLYRSKLANPIFTDNFIEDPAIPRTKVGDQYWNGKPGFGGNVTVPGTFLLFELNDR